MDEIQRKKFLDIEKKLSEMGENEKNPRLRFDAFMGGVKDGGLRSVSSISLMVCYIVSNLSGKITSDIIAKALAEGELANHFEVTNALSKLIKSGTIVEADDGTLSINKNTKADIELIAKELPYTVRESAMHLCQKIIAKETYRRENKVEIIPTGDAYTVILHISGKGTDYLTLSLFAGTIDQAEMIKEKFITDPVKVYETLIDAIFENEE